MRKSLIDHFLILQLPNKFADGNQGVLIGVKLLFVHHHGSKWQLQFSNLPQPHHRQIERPHKLDSCLIFSVPKAAIVKASISFLETFKIRLYKTLSNLIKLKMSLCFAGVVARDGL